jgi:hypothetical protein
MILFDFQALISIVFVNGIGTRKINVLLYISFFIAPNELSRNLLIKFCLRYYFNLKIGEYLAFSDSS